MGGILGVAQIFTILWQDSIRAFVIFVALRDDFDSEINELNHRICEADCS